MYGVKDKTTTYLIPNRFFTRPINQPFSLSLSPFSSKPGPHRHQHHHDHDHHFNWKFYFGSEFVIFLSLYKTITPLHQNSWGKRVLKRTEKEKANCFFFFGFFFSSSKKRKMRKPEPFSGNKNNSSNSSNGGSNNNINGVKLRKGLWSPEEDDKLMNYMLTNGQGCWSDVARNAGLQRCGKSCRLRWINYLRPDLKRGAFSPQEEELIVHLHSLLGNRFTSLSLSLSICLFMHNMYILYHQLRRSSVLVALGFE